MSTTKGNTGVGTSDASIETVQRIDCGYLPDNVQEMLTNTLNEAGEATGMFHAPGETPTGAFAKLTYDDGSFHGQRGWHLDVIVERQDIATGQSSARVGAQSQRSGMTG